jgi:hypothetical protein
VLRGRTIAQACRRAGVTEPVARQWLGLYLDTAVKTQGRVL